MLRKIALSLSERCLLTAPARMVVGVSGGPDSLCLLHVLHTLGHELLVAHFDHQLRPESADEADSVRDVATALGLPFARERADVRAYARDHSISIEEAGRELRYEFLFSHARRVSAEAVAVGHTADDQVETLLMHILRGSGLRGLAGMAYRSLPTQFDSRVPLIRPLLGTWRTETEEYCEANGLRPHHDPSNVSPDYFRNRVRHELIPQLETYNPRVRSALWRTAEVIAADLALIDESVARAWEQTVWLDGTDHVSFDAAELAGLSTALRRRLLAAAVRQLLPETETSFAVLDDAASFVEDAGSRRLDLGSGLVMARERGRIFVGFGLPSWPQEMWPQMQRASIPIPERLPVTVPLPNGWQFTAEYVPAGSSPMVLIPARGDRFRACLDADAIPEGLELRPPRLGDRIRSLGLHGHSQKLSDLFVNEKLPARARKTWPLLCSNETVVWVPGFLPADAYKLKVTTRQVACFALSRAHPQDSG